MRSLTPGGLCAGADKYYPNNFNDFLSGIVTLFELMIVNNWFVIADGITAAYGSEYARAYFIGFWLVARWRKGLYSAQWRVTPAHRWSI